jgi:hypothetical protein
MAKTYKTYLPEQDRAARAVLTSCETPSMTTVD